MCFFILYGGLDDYIGTTRFDNNYTYLLNNKDKYIIDPTNRFILQIQNDWKLKSLNPEYLGQLEYYQEEHIAIVDKILKKYYTYKELGIDNVYS